MTPEDVAKIEYVGGVAVSPDGSHVAYTTISRPDVTEGEEDGGATQQLFLASGAGDARAWLPEDMNVSGLAFSPDGTMISFRWADEDEKTAVWGVPVKGGAYRKLAAVDGASISSYEWSADGSRLYLLAGPAKDEQRDKQKKAGFDAIVYEEEDRFNRMFIANVGKDIDEEPAEIAVPGHVDEFNVTPDGRYAVVGSAPTTLVDDSFVAKRHHIVDLTTGEVIRIIGTTGKVGDAEISRDGRTMSLVAAVDQHDPADTTLHLVNLADGSIRALNAGAAEAAVDAEWLDNGRLAAVIHVGTQSRLRIYNPDGSVAREVDPGDLVLASLESNGEDIVVRADSPSHPFELFSYNRGNFTRWTTHNPWLSEIDMGVQRNFTYTARDGQEIEGVLIEPVGGTPAGGAPLILDVHGGPEAHESNGFKTDYGAPGQVAAGKGYAVFLPNYRGSTAYGIEFAKQHQADAAGKEFDDLVDAKRALVTEGIADADRVGVTGGSYGGFATAWSSTRYSEEFAAGVMFIGISNILSKYGTTDIPKEEYLVHARDYPWEDYMDTLRRSPLYYTDNAKTPLLIMHGEEDLRVSVTQSEELYRWIKVRQPETPLRLVIYPGEGHGNAGAAARYDYNLRMMRWFDTYLMTGDRDAEMPPTRPELPDAITGEDSDD
ncbi:S9 family peptidase [Altererythrobacter sp. MF3-039]|uniref:S9 family peptidase n=1 Tax=Altererythrobacter sp. MF3-039 TaxID=3252901 RepID=UPI00390C7F79